MNTQTICQYSKHIVFSSILEL